MHCPACGNESSLEQKFCRKCGFDLSPVSKLIAGSSGSETAGIDRRRREQVLVRRMFRWISAGMIVMLFGVLMLLIGRTFDIGKIFGLASTIVILTGVAIACGGLFSTMMRGAAVPALKESPDIRLDDLEQAPTTRRLEGDRMPVPLPSVTERTTQLIDKER